MGRSQSLTNENNQYTTTMKKAIEITIGFASKPANPDERDLVITGRPFNKIYYAEDELEARKLGLIDFINRAQESDECQEDITLADIKRVPGDFNDEYSTTIYFEVTEPHSQQAGLYLFVDAEEADSVLVVY